MKRIGTIAAKLIANPIELVAAANQKRGTEFADGSPNEGVNEPSRRSVGDAHPTRATGVESPGDCAPPGVTAVREVKPRGELKLIVDNTDRRTAFAAKNGRTQRPAVRLSLVLVSGGHARTTPW